MAKPGVQTEHILVNGEKSKKQDRKEGKVIQKIEKFSTFKKGIIMRATIACVKGL